MLDLLHIAALRHGVSGDPKSPAAANYDEAKAGPSSPLPDPLKLKDGAAVTSADIWWRQRRQEIADDYETEVYGHMPSGVPLPTWTVLAKAAERVGGVAALTRHLIGRAAKAGASVDIRLTITLPAGAKKPVPVILLLAPDPAKLHVSSAWRELVLKKGWGAAELDVYSVQPDSGADLANGIIGLVAGGKPREPGDWGALRAWAWGASRAMDYFESDLAIDSGRVGIAGHSRFGKAALVAMAYDPRYVVAFVSSSGAGGAAPLRRNFGERIENLAAASEYHWFAGNFLKYAGPLTADDLPVDSHELIALCAPRPVFMGAGLTGDGWVDARGMFLAQVAAGPVYRLLGARGLGTATMPPVGTASTDGALAFRQHAGGHTPEPNWPFFLAFARRYLDRPR
ncbi:MAG TPA: hypothetical protein VGB91_07465 [Rhizomicrobium sp.]